MKKIPTWLFIFPVLLILCIFLITYKQKDFSITQQNFSMNEVLNICVEEYIHGISTNYHEVVIVRTTDKVIAYNLKSGVRIWMNSIEQQRDPFPVAINENAVFVADENRLRAYDLMSGGVLWQTHVENADTWIPGVSDQYVLLNSLSDRLYVYDSHTGKLLWSVRVGRGYTNAFIDQDIVYVINNGIIAYRVADGEHMWNESNNLAIGENTYSDGIFYFLEYPEDGTFNLVAYDAEKRAVLWRTSFIDEIANGMYVHNGNLYLSTIYHVYRIDITNGGTIWQKKIPHSKDVSFLNEYIYALENSQKTIHILSVMNGEEVGSIKVNSWGVFDKLYQNIISTQSAVIYSVGCHLVVLSNKK